MSACFEDNGPLVEKTFENQEDWVDWLRQNHPALLREGAFRIDREGFHQRGTGYYWSCLERV